MWQWSIGIGGGIWRLMESIVVVSQNDESAKKEAKTGKKDGK